MILLQRREREKGVSERKREQRELGKVVANALKLKGFFLAAAAVKRLSKKFEQKIKLSAMS